MRHLTHCIGRATILTFCVSFGLFVYSDAPSYVTWRIGDFPDLTFNNTNGYFYPLGDKALCFTNGFLFGTDGTLEGTYKVTDNINTMIKSRRVLVQYQSHGYYRKLYSGGLTGLGRTNYEPGNDELFWEADPELGSAHLSPVGVMGGYLLFVHDRSLYRTDGAEDGTEVLYNFASTYEFPSFGAFFTNIIVEGDYLFFVAGPADGVHGLWRTDGTPSGTINLAQRSSAPLSTLAGGNGLVFFTARATTGAQLWRTDGTTQGTQQIASFPSQGFPSSYIVSSSYSNSRFWFGVIPHNELWYTDGTAAGTKRVRTFQMLPQGLGRQLEKMQAAGDKLLFTASEGELGHYLWVSDGTEQGTFKLTNSQSVNGWTKIFFYGELEGQVLFGADTSGNHRIWVSNGTGPGTRKVSDTVITTNSPFKYKDHYLMIGRDESTSSGLWGLREDTPFQFRTQPTPKNYYYEGDSLQLMVEIPSWHEAAASYQWFKDNVPLEGENANELYIGMLTLADSGRYFCRVTVDDKTTSHDSAMSLVRVLEEGSLPLASVALLAGLMVSLCAMAIMLLPKHTHK